MKVYLSFDIEIWCDGWDRLDEAFPAAFDRYVYGRSRHGYYALPKTLDILNQHGLHGVFFVEPLFAARFGQQHLNHVVGLIRAAGQEVQLHLHAEWTNEALQPLIPDNAEKRQHLSYYTLEEQTALIAHGRRMLEAAGSGPVTTFRGGSFAANADSFEAMRRNGIYLDSSLNRCYTVSGPEVLAGHALETAFEVAGVTTYPITVFRDGFGKARPAQIGSCSFAEMRDALLSAEAAGAEHFVIVSHNFEMLKIDSTAPDWAVVKRFNQLCAFLARHADRFEVGGFANSSQLPSMTRQEPAARLASTLRRHLEQAFRRLF